MAAGASRRTNSSGGLSLRTRLLVLQIAVTTVFLLVMGIVSTVLFASHLQRQFDAIILAESTRSPADIASRPGLAVVAVEVTERPYAVLPLTTDSVATRALVTAVGRMSRRQVIGLGQGDQLFSVPSAGLASPTLEAAARLIPGAENQSGLPSILIVAERASALTSQLRGLILAEMITGGGLIALLAIGGQWLIGRGLGPLDRMARTANDITARGDLTERMAESDDETDAGRLGAAINTMLDRIQQAFGARLNSERKVREFAADASHELRTPLTTIRGYAELYRQGALGPDQLPGAMRRIEQEAQRMSTLVAELLELARLDRTSSLDLTETDLATVVRDAVADAMAVEPDRPISAQAPPRLIALVDERRIRQVLANLLANVRAHTPRSAPVAVRLGPVQGGVLIEVADSGPGMSSEDAARAFDRFHRAAERDEGTQDAGGWTGPVGAAGNGSAAQHGQPGSRAGGSGAQHGQPGGQTSGSAEAGYGSGGTADGPPTAGPDYSGGGGSGLGLSIVQAIANAHGGQATLESWPGHGTRVRIWLPARAATTPGS
ncbi:MAG TPA: ATP-binding protein [Streptosporangiaceae bacterium]|nr:ATP-binding protein [Streptosporangiaceae bacterium]